MNALFELLERRPILVPIEYKGIPESLAIMSNRFVTQVPMVVEIRLPP
jgi:hypothetical protein